MTAPITTEEVIIEIVGKTIVNAIKDESYVTIFFSDGTSVEISARTETRGYSIDVPVIEVEINS